MSELVEETQLCSKCGTPVPVRIVYRTLQPRGSGWRGANKIKKLNRTQRLCLRALLSGDGKRGIPATDFNSGMELTDVWSKVREFAFAVGQRVPTKQGCSGRLSEMQGLDPPLTASEDNVVELQDSDSQQFRGKKHFQRWYLVDEERARRCEETGLL